MKRRQLPSTKTNPLAEVDDGLGTHKQRRSESLIYESVMRGGGEPFGAPFGPHVASLTERVVRFFRQRGFFGFDTLEKPQPKRNRFTRYGAARYRGSYRAEPNEDES